MPPDVLKAVLITGFCVALFVIVPIVAIMTEHQRKMARLIRGDQTETNDTAEIISALNGTPPSNTKEVQALKERVSLLEQQVSELKSSLHERETVYALEPESATSSLKPERA